MAPPLDKFCTYGGCYWLLQLAVLHVAVGATVKLEAWHGFHRAFCGCFRATWEGSRAWWSIGAVFPARFIVPSRRRRWERREVCLMALSGELFDDGHVVMPSDRA